MSAPHVPSPDKAEPHPPVSSIIIAGSKRHRLSGARQQVPPPQTVVWGRGSMSEPHVPPPDRTEPRPPAPSILTASSKARRLWSLSACPVAADSCMGSRRDCSEPRRLRPPPGRSSRPPPRSPPASPAKRLAPVRQVPLPVVVVKSSTPIPRRPPPRSPATGRSASQADSRRVRHNPSPQNPDRSPRD